MAEEQPRHREAYNLYLSMGSNRSYKRVADQLGVSPSTIKGWSRSFHWQQRIKAHDANSVREATERVTQLNRTETARNLKIVRAAILKLAKGIAENRITPRIGDLDDLVRLEEYLEKKPATEQSDLPRDPKGLRARARELLIIAIKKLTPDELQTEYEAFRPDLTPELDQIYRDNLREKREELAQRQAKTHQATEPEEVSHDEEA